MALLPLLLRKHVVVAQGTPPAVPEKRAVRFVNETSATFGAKSVAVAVGCAIVAVPVHESVESNVTDAGFSADAPKTWTALAKETVPVEFMVITDSNGENVIASPENDTAPAVSVSTVIAVIAPPPSYDTDTAPSAYDVCGALESYATAVVAKISADAHVAAHKAIIVFMATFLSLVSFVLYQKKPQVDMHTFFTGSA